MTKQVISKNKDQTKTPVATTLRNILATVKTFPDHKNIAYAKIGGQAMPMRSEAFSAWLTSQAIRLYPDIVLSKKAVDDAIYTAIAHARQKPAEKVYVRVARVGSKVYLDCGDDYIEATEDGVQVLSSPAPVNFVRADGWLPIDMSNPQGNLDDFFSLLNLPTDDRILIWGWLTNIASGGSGQFPLLILSGEQGTAKSTIAGFLSSLVDPKVAGLSSPFKDEQNLCITASREYVLAFDNLSKLTSEASDALCRLADGTGIKLRTLYTNDEQTVFSSARPVILTGITIEAWRGDLADRSIQIRLEPIPAASRQRLADLKEAFESLHAGALLDLMESVSTGLRNLGRPAANLPRMADFVAFVSGAEAGRYEAGEFLLAFNANQKDSLKSIADDDLFIDALRYATRDGFSDTLTNLFARLPAPKPVAGYPTTRKSLSNWLGRNAPMLRALGWQVENERRTQARIWNITPPTATTVEEIVDAKLGGILVDA